MGTEKYISFKLYKDKPKTQWGCLIALVLGVIWIMWVITPSSSRPSYPRYVAHNINNAREIVMAMKVHASEHGGAYPDDLRQLVSESIINEEWYGMHGSIKLDGGRENAEWIYLRGLNDSLPPDHMVLVSPPFKSAAGFFEKLWEEYGRGVVIPSVETRIVGLNDGQVTVMKEPEFQKHLLKTGQTLPPPAPTPNDAK